MRFSVITCHWLLLHLVKFYCIDILFLHWFECIETDSENHDWRFVESTMRRILKQWRILAYSQDYCRKMLKGDEKWLLIETSEQIDESSGQKMITRRWKMVVRQDKRANWWILRQKMINRRWEWLSGMTSEQIDKPSLSSAIFWGMSKAQMVVTERLSYNQFLQANLWLYSSLFTISWRNGCLRPQSPFLPAHKWSSVQLPYEKAVSGKVMIIRQSIYHFLT